MCSMSLILYPEQGHHPSEGSGERAEEDKGRPDLANTEYHTVH